MDAECEEFLQRINSVRIVFHGEYLTAIMLALVDGPKHYKELLSVVRSVDIFDGWREDRHVISESIVTRTLKRMTTDGLVRRVEYPGAFQPSVTTP